jgi:predicted methyltransferase
MINNLYEKIIDAEKISGVPAKKILDFLFYLKDGNKVDNTVILEKTGVSKSALIQIEKLLSFLLFPASKNTQLRSNLTNDVSNLFDNYYQTEENILSIFSDDRFEKMYKTFSSLTYKKIPPERRYDQFNATSETSVKRSFLLNYFGDIKGKRILFLGDDDYTSVATSLFEQAKEIIAVDIDKRILKKIDEISLVTKQNITTREYDACDPLSPLLQNKFDIVFTDPPYTENGISLFLSRAIAALENKNTSARIYFCFGVSDRSKDKILPVQRIINESGLIFRHVFDRFNRYKGAESIGSASNLYILEKTYKTKPLVEGSYHGKIYTDD